MNLPRVTAEEARQAADAVDYLTAVTGLTHGEVWAELDARSCRSPLPLGAVVDRLKHDAAEGTWP